MTEITQADRDAAFDTGLRLNKSEWETLYLAFARHRIEALSAENERLRQALQDVSAIWRRHKYSGDFDLWLNAYIRAALGETK